MNSFYYLNLRFIKFVFPALLTLILSGAAFGATFTVTKTADTDDGVCDADCSLREAIAAANSAGSNDIIDFDSTVFASFQEIMLGGTELTVANNGSLSINGTGKTLLLLRGIRFQPTFVQSRVFYVSPQANFTLNNLNIIDGNSQGTVNSGVGGAIYNDNAVLTLNNCSVGSSRAADSGGGIFNNLGTLNVNNSIIRNNSAVSGGGIGNLQGMVFVNNSEIIFNTSRLFGGGGVYNDGSLTINNSSVGNNTATASNQNGGGVLNLGNAQIINSTFSNNAAGIYGGAIYNTGGLSLQSVTVGYNVSRTATASSGGGISNATGGTFSARNTIVGKNVIGQDAYGDPNAVPSDVAGTLNSLGYNLIQDASQAVITGITIGNILNVDPQLSVGTGRYGGPTQTFALKINSPAIDAGDPVNFPTTDQRGFPRPIDGDGNGSALPDIGAYETGRVTVPSTFTVNNTSDGGTGSLRNAIESSNATFGSDTINFDPAVFNTPKTITLINSSLEIASDSNLVINGPGANLLNVTSKRRNTVFIVTSFDAVAVLNNLTVSEGTLGIYNFGTLTLNDSIVRNNGFSGGLYSLGNTTINNSIFRNNESQLGGAGVSGNFGSTIINNSTITDNISYGRSSPISCGGGVLQSYGTMSVNNSVIKNNTITVFSSGGGGVCGIFGSQVNLTNVTIAGNSAGGGGGGGGVMSYQSTVNLVNSTVVNNSTISSNGGGGIANTFPNGSQSAVIMSNTIVANNTASSAPDFAGTLTSQGYNLIKNTTGATITGNTTGNITGVDPHLDPAGLRENGGATKTIALLPGSPAVDAANPNSFPPIDQRGFTRPIDGDGNGSVLPDIGAFERQINEVSIKTLFDFDGDGKSDVSVFRPSNGVWYLNQSTSGFAGVTFGVATDIIAPADFDGDGKTDVAVFRPSNGSWYYLRSSDNGFVAAQFGTNGDIPRPADYDGDRKADLTVFRPSNGAWYRLNSSDNSFFGTFYGQNGDKPLVADFDGDGKSDLAVFRPSTASFYWTNSSNGGFNAVQFGLGTDIPTPADFDGDGETDVAVFRPSNGSWYRLNSADNSFFGVQFGANGDVPTAADYDGDGKADVAVFRNGNWYRLNSTNGAFVGLQFGLGTDKAIPAAFLQ